MEPKIDALEDASLRILVVEDDALLRFVIADALRDDGVTVIEAANGDEAWDALAAGMAVDLLFTDHRMPGSMTGAELAAKVAARWPDLPIVMTSGDYDGFSGRLIRKPYEIGETVAELCRTAKAAKGVE